MEVSHTAFYDKIQDDILVCWMLRCSFKLQILLQGFSPIDYSSFERHFLSTETKTVFGS